MVLRSGEEGIARIRPFRSGRSGGRVREKQVPHAIREDANGFGMTIGRARRGEDWRSMLRQYKRKAETELRRGSGEGRWLPLHAKLS